MSAALAVEQHADAQGFLEAAQHWLLEAEAENNLLLGIALHWRGRPATDPRPYWASVRDARGIVGCAGRTPPHPLVLSRMPAAAMPLLIDDVSAAYSSVSGVNGPATEAEAFARAWVARHGGRSRTRFRLRLHMLTTVSVAAQRPSGALRKLTAADLPIAREWMDEFARDTGTPPLAQDLLQHRIGHGQLFFWLDGANPQAMVSYGRETRSGCSINAVYTPPRFRQSGYATAAVAALSDSLLKAGRRFCCLYTDLANPTSNSIYAKIGYRPIRDDAEIAFEP